MIYLQSSYVQTSVKGYIQLFTNEKTIYKPKTENFKLSTRDNTDIFEQHVSLVHIFTRNAVF